MSADRTLMSVIRTSLSLIGFGFTIAQVFEKLRDAGTLTSANAPRNFGLALVFLGVALLVMGIWQTVVRLAILIALPFAPLMLTIFPFNELIGRLVGMLV